MTNNNHAQVKGSPGQFARLRGLFVVSWPVVLVMILAGYLLRTALPLPQIHQTLAGFLFIALALLLVVLMNRAESRLSAFNKGAEGEEAVARELGFLPADYRVFNCIASGKEALLPSNGDYDHVVVGPTGIFLIETKNWSGSITLEDGEILYNGKRPDSPPITQVKKAALSLHTRLQNECSIPGDVRPVLCFAANKFVSGTKGSNGVIVCNIRDLNSVITDKSSGTIIPHEIQLKAAGFLNGLIN